MTSIEKNSNYKFTYWQFGWHIWYHRITVYLINITVRPLSRITDINILHASKSSGNAQIQKEPNSKEICFI